MRNRPLRYTAALTLAAASLMAIQGAPNAYASTNPVEVTLTLAAPHASALAALAADTTDSTDVRRAKLAALLPSDAAHSRIAQILGAQGFRVLSESSWTMTVSAPQNLVTSLFGLLPINPTTLTQALAPFPTVPSSLVGLVQLASPTVTNVPAWHSSAVVQPSSPNALRDAYTAPGVSPGSGKSVHGALTIATIQFSNWNQNDLTRYAARYHHPDPIATHQLRTVRVDGGATDSNGQVEVGLDQEGIWATSPYSNQQLYSAPNTTAGFNDAFSAVLDDVLGNSRAQARNPRIAALSTSWGGCESATGLDNIRAAQPILQSLVAAGVNIFAPAGDNGIYDCGPSSSGSLLGGLLGGSQGPTASVDFPASSPYVIGVGGTRLASATSAIALNNGRNWSESAWSCSSASDCASNGGTGGGQSIYFGAPLFQRAFVNAQPYVGRGRRLVPDIAATADPASGLVISTSDPSANANGQLLVGGTSLATPVSAALYVNLLASLGRTRGVGDLHVGIYRAAAAHQYVRDVRSGINGAPTDAGNDPSVRAAAGYDTLTGVGSVLWSGLAGYLPR